MRKIFPGAVNANSNIPEKCFRMMLLKKKLLELLEDSTDIIHKHIMINRYQIRLYEDIIDKLCYESFLKRYRLEQKNRKLFPT